MEAVELLNGKIAAVHYEGHRISLGETVCTYYASDNNGAGYKERADYASLICGEPIDFPRDFYKVEGDTVIFNAKTPTDPYAFLYVFVTPWQREAAEPIRHVVIEDDVTQVSKYLLSSMRGLKSVHQPAAINRRLADGPACEVFIGGIRMVDAFISWDGHLVVVREDAEEVRIPGEVKEIHEGAFRDCPSLKRLVVHKGVHTVVENTFVAFDSELTVCCEAGEKPEGWAVDVDCEDGPRFVWGYKS